MNLADRLREFAGRLPAGGSLTLTRDALLELAAFEEGQPAPPPTSADSTVTELAARFHRSRSTIRDWCEHGRFDGAYKLNGRDWRIPQEAVETFLALQRRAHRQAPVSLSAWRVIRTAD